MIARRQLYALLVLLACCPVATAAVRGAASAREREQAIVAELKQQPLIFFVAKGRPSACGPHCITWIAADGMIDSDAARRFRAFLAGRTHGCTDQQCDVKILLANSEPSTHGT